MRTELGGAIVPTMPDSIARNARAGEGAPGGDTAAGAPRFSEALCRTGKCPGGLSICGAAQRCGASWRAELLRVVVNEAASEYPALGRCGAGQGRAEAERRRRSAWAPSEATFVGGVRGRRIDIPGRCRIGPDDLRQGPEEGRGQAAVNAVGIRQANSVTPSARRTPLVRVVQPDPERSRPRLRRRCLARWLYGRRDERHRLPRG